MSVVRAVFGRAVAMASVALFAGCGGGGYGGGGGAAPAAALNMSIEPATITLGQSATITWNSNAGVTCTAGGEWSGPRPASGSETVTPTRTGTLTYTLICGGGGYRDSDAGSATLTVNPAGGFTPTVIVSKFAGSAARITDPRLVEPGSIAVAPNAAAWVASPSASIAYDGNGRAQALSFGVDFDPTGIVVNVTRHFVMSAGARSAAAELIYAGRDGRIAAWSPAIDAAKTVTVYVDDNGAVYSGLTMASSESRHFLYATDFRNNRIDVFDANFRKQTSSGARFAFRDPALPDGYAPFGIQAIESGQAGDLELCVTYAAPMPPDRHEPAVGTGLGLVNVFDTQGRLLRRLVSAGGVLNAPWGIARAPEDFGTLSGTLLLGNAGDGRIHAYDPTGGRFMGTVSDAAGRPIVIQGLRGIAFGNDTHGQPHNVLFFAAANDETDGIYGRIDLDAPP